MKSLLQTPEWVNFKVSQGWESFLIDGVYVLSKKLPYAGFLYAPEVTIASLKNLDNFLESVKKIAEKNKSIFFRLEIVDENNPDFKKILETKRFVKAFEEIQPEWRQVVDISPTVDEILNQMKPKGRYNIRVAQRHNVRVKISPPEDFEQALAAFYDLYQQTSEYQKISSRNQDYFAKMLKGLYTKNEAAILVAFYNNIPLSGLIITFYDGVASYLYGGTSRQFREVMAPYLAHFEAIKLAKERGCRAYDLLAVAPEGAQDHKYSNLTFFKEQFGGRKINIMGSYDLIYKPFCYRIFRQAEKFRRR